MNKDGYYINHAGEKIIIPCGMGEMNYEDSGIKEMVFPEGGEYTEIVCWNNEIKEIIIPEGCRVFDCGSNKLRELIIPKSIKDIHCDDNKIKELIFPNGIKNIFCHNNNISELIIPEGVDRVFCDKGLLDLEKERSGVKYRIEIYF